MNKRAQVALEFLTTYGWVIVGVLLLFAVLFYYGSFDPTRFMPNQCNFEQGLQCTAYRFQGATSPASPTRLILQFSNNFPYDVAFSGNGSDITVENVGNIGKQTYIGNCSPMFPNIAKRNTLITCVFNIYNPNSMPSAGKKIKFQVELNYTNCITDPNYLVNGSCMFGTNYTTKGTVLTPLESNISQTYGYCGDAVCSSSENPNNCPSDCPPPTTILLNVSPNLVVADGTNYSNATARVFDKNGQGIEGIEVAFISTPIGIVSDYSATTDQNGKASVRITSTVAGTADVRATSYGIYNLTKLTFAPSVNLQFSPFDDYTCNGSYLVIRVVDSNGAPVTDIPVNFLLNVSPSIATISPNPEVTDISGYAISYLKIMNPVTTQFNMNVTAFVDIPTYNIHVNSSQVVHAVQCQACGAPTQGDWIIDKKVDCENTTIALNGNLNISFDAAYIHNWGDLTFKNVSLVINSQNYSLHGIYMNRMARFSVLDNDNNPDTNLDASNIGSNFSFYPFWYHYTADYPFIFNVGPTADKFIMKNSNLYGPGFYRLWRICYHYLPSQLDKCYWTLPFVNLSTITDYQTGLFVSSSNSIIQNNTFWTPYHGIDSSVISTIILNGSSNTTITGNIFGSDEEFPLVSGGVSTAVLLANSSNNNVSNNTIITMTNYHLEPFNFTNPAIILYHASNNTISSNYITGIPQILYTGAIPAWYSPRDFPQPMSGPAVSLSEAQPAYYTNPPPLPPQPQYPNYNSTGSVPPGPAVSLGEAQTCPPYCIPDPPDPQYPEYQLIGIPVPPGPALLLMDGSTGNYIANNYLTGFSYEVLLSSSNQNTFYNNQILNFQIYAATTSLFTQTAGIYATNSSNNIFENNYLYNGSLVDAYGYYPPTPSYQIYLEQALGNSFINNTLGRYPNQEYLPCNAGSYDILVNSSQSNYFTKNKLYGCGSMKVLSSPNTVVDQMVMNRSAMNSNPQDSLSFVYSPGSNVTNSSNITNMSFSYCGAGNNILENKITGINSSYGILIDSSNATISSNAIGLMGCQALKNGILATNSSIIMSNNNLTNFTVAGIYIDNHNKPSLTGSIQGNNMTNIGRCNTGSRVYGITTWNAAPVNITSNKLYSYASAPTYCGGIYFNYSVPNVTSNIISMPVTSIAIFCTTGTYPTLVNNVMTGLNSTCVP
ncbi:MAG: Ig-like domain-containing protein [Candidatus Micrarchaeota archaeon]|nr:Ig-like domain-containing protein [Candidatus Micrarchaeota archaeon]